VIVELALYDPIQQDQRIDYFTTVEAKPPVICPGARDVPAALKMGAKLEPAASIASHGTPRLDESITCLNETASMVEKDVQAFTPD
jgi:hypothetical protein